MSDQHSTPLERPLGPDILNAVRYYLSGRRALVALAAVAVVGGLAFNWGWLVAIGVAPIIITALPCVVMCALGLCMHKMNSGTSQAPDSAAVRPPAVDLSWMRSQNLAAALPAVAKRDDVPEVPEVEPANDSRPATTASCCSPTSAERS